MEKNYVKIVKKKEDMERIIKVDEVEVEVFGTSEEFEFLKLTHPLGKCFEEAYAHKGEEAVYVIEGQVDYQLGDEKIRMSPGDWLWHPSSIIHNSINIGEIRSKMLYNVGPSTWLHPEVDENLIKPEPHPPIVGKEEPYLYVPAGYILDKKEIDGVILKTRIMAPRIMGYEIVFPQSSLRFNIKPNLFEGVCSLYVLEGSIKIEIGETKDMLSSTQAVIFSSKLGCLCTSQELTQLLIYNTGGRYYVPGNPKIVKEEKE